MLRNKEPELAEKIDSSFGCFDLGFYRVNFVFGSRHLIIVRLTTQQPRPSSQLCRVFSPVETRLATWFFSK